MDSSLTYRNYKQYEYLKEGFPDVLAMSDIVISRAGSNAIFEILSQRKPMILIPLTAEQSRGDQIYNARHFEKSGFCEVVYEQNMTNDVLIAMIEDVYDNRFKYIEKMKKTDESGSISKVIEIIKQFAL